MIERLHKRIYDRGGAGCPLFGILTGVLAALFGVMWLIHPLNADDLWYLAGSTGTHGSWEYFTTTVSNCIEHWTYDTGRLCNFMSAPFLSLLPRWVYALICALMMWYILCVGRRLGDFPTWSVRNSLWIATVVFAIPWFEYLFTIIYSINYIWGIFLGLLLIDRLMVLYPDSSRHSRLSILLFFLLGIITGWWHEGLSVMLIAGLCTWYAVRLRRPAPASLAAVVGLATGIATILCMPAFGNQLGIRESMLIKTVLWETLVNLFLWNCFFYCFVIAAVLALALRKTRRRLLADSRRELAWVTAILVGGTVATVIYIKYFNGARTGLFCQTMCALGLLRLLPVFFPTLNRHAYKSSPSYRPSAAGIGAIAVILLLGYINMGYAIATQRRLTQEFNAVMQLADADLSGHREVYFDATPISFGPDLLKPSYQALNTAYGLGSIMVQLFPSQLEDFSFSSTEARRCSDPRLYLYRDMLVLRGDEPAERWDIILTLTDGNQVRSRTRTRPFHLSPATPDTVPADTVARYVIPHSQALSAISIIDARIATPVGPPRHPSE